MNTETVRQLLPQKRQKTITRHFEKLVEIFRINRVEWTQWNMTKFLFSAAFWLPYYILGGYLTIKTSIDLIQQYAKNPIYLAMTASISQQIMTFPNHTVCFHGNMIDYFDSLDARNRKGSEESYSEILKKFFDESTQNGTFSPIQWPHTINGILIRYFTVVYELEWQENPVQNSIDWQQYEKAENEPWLALRNVFVPNIIEHKITIDQLLAAFQETYYGLSNKCTSNGCSSCIFTIVNLDQATSTCTYTCAPRHLISFIGGNSFCFRLFDIEFVVVEGALDSYNNKLTIQIVLPKEENGQWPVTADFTGRSSPPPSSQFYRVFPFHISVCKTLRG